MTVAEFEQREEHLLGLIHDKLKSGSYRFQPARRVLIPKPGTSKKRKLGIPAVVDRIVGTSMHYVLEAIFDSQFTESNFGFRWGRSQHQAIWQLQRLVNDGSKWAVAVDLKAFFDEIPHGLMLKLIRRNVADEQFVTLLARRNDPLSMYQVIHELSKYLRGWVGYFGIQEFKYLFRNLDAWIRGRLRSTQLKKWKKPGKFQRIMIRAGFDPTEAHRVWIKMNRWQSVMRRPMRFVMNLDWFRKRGLVFLHDHTIAFSRA